MAFGGTFGYIVFVAFVAWQSGKCICVCFCERARVCAHLLRKEMLVCGAHPLSASSLAVITWGGWW